MRSPQPTLPQRRTDKSLLATSPPGPKAKQNKLQLNSGDMGLRTVGMMGVVGGIRLGRGYGYGELSDSIY